MANEITNAASSSFDQFYRQWHSLFGCTEDAAREMWKAAFVEGAMWQLDVCSAAIKEAVPA